MPTISSKIEICMTKAAFLQFKGIWGSDRPTVLCLYLFITLTPSSPPFPLISRPLHIFLCFIYFALFTSSSPLPLLPLFLSTALLHLLFFPLSYLSACLPRGDSKQWIYSNGKKRAGLKKEAPLWLVLPPAPLYRPALPTVPIFLRDTNVAGKTWVIPQTI